MDAAHIIEWFNLNTCQFFGAHDEFLVIDVHIPTY